MTDNRDVRYNPERRNRWQDWANFVLAIWLFFSPWILSFGSGAPAAAPAQGAQAVNAVNNAAWNAWVLGVLVFLVAISAISRMEFWQEWINLLLGAWIFIAPLGARLRVGHAVRSLVGSLDRRGPNIPHLGLEHQHAAIVRGAPSRGASQALTYPARANAGRRDAPVKWQTGVRICPGSWIRLCRGDIGGTPPRHPH
jgi:hypothetical protein